jgi:hypothetical protein
MPVIKCPCKEEDAAVNAVFACEQCSDLFPPGAGFCQECITLQHRLYPGHEFQPLESCVNCEEQFPADATEFCYQCGPNGSRYCWNCYINVHQRVQFRHLPEQLAVPVAQSGTMLWASFVATGYGNEIVLDEENIMVLNFCGQNGQRRNDGFIQPGAWVIIKRTKETLAHNYVSVRENGLDHYHIIGKVTNVVQLDGHENPRKYRLTVNKAVPRGNVFVDDNDQMFHIKKHVTTFLGFKNGAFIPGITTHQPIQEGN